MGNVYICIYKKYIFKFVKNDRALSDALDDLYHRNLKIHKQQLKSSDLTNSK